MDGPPFLLSVLINKECYASSLIDSGCLSYGLIDSRFARKHKLQRMRIRPRETSGYDGYRGGEITEVATMDISIDGYGQEKAFFYVVPRLAEGYDMILGKPWIIRNDVVYYAKDDLCTIGGPENKVRNQSVWEDQTLDCVSISAVAYSALARKGKKKHQKVEIFSASMADIDKALAKREKRTDPRTKLPEEYHEFLDLFDHVKAELLPPLRGAKIDHEIELEKENGKDKEIPWGPLYNMSRDELLVLRKTLTDYLDKGFIRVSNSPAAAPVLFVRKPGGGLRFCVDYRGLNRITRKDRYPLPLIYETLRNIGQAKWYTKLDVIAAFHRIRIAQGDEWKTAFRTRYGLYEWLVTPFGLANAPSTFQKYINWALRDYLDEFCSAYMDDVLVFSSGSKEEHQEHVRKVLARLSSAGLQLDIDKSEFSVTSTKYLGFVLEAGQGVRMDPRKVQAILEWEAPRSVKGVQSFLGFANFYRRFIENYSKITMPIFNTTRKDSAFQWTQDADQAFERLKRMFIEAPILVPFEYDRTTMIETDSSGWCIGGTLFQLDDKGLWRPCAYFSKKNQPAECNYEIYDKEMLAIVRCLEEWDAELRSVPSFRIRTDHKNLEYFMTVRKLTERQMRWSLILSKYNFTIEYLSGKQNARADALSRREQDMPAGTDERTDYRMVQLLRPETLKELPTTFAAPVTTRGQARQLWEGQLVDEPKTASGNAAVAEASDEPAGRRTEREATLVGEIDDIRTLWDEAELSDKAYKLMTQAIQKEKRVFPLELLRDYNTRVSIGECTLDARGKLCFRGRRWVPDSEPLRTGVIQKFHDSVLVGHPGREVLSAVLSRQYFWPGMLQQIRQFTRNCDKCGSSKSWRDRRQGFLKPLPVPNRIWREISMDFIVDLPLSSGCTNLMVITDRLGKGVILESLPDISTDTVADAFIRCFYRHHGFPDAIVSDRGTQFTGQMWTRVCSLLKIIRRLSTAFHPETDGATERMNQNVEVYIRIFCNYAQDNWASLLPMAELAINNHDATSTGVSPFFLAHGYHLNPLQIDDEEIHERPGESPVVKGERIVRKLRDATEWAQSAMATAQQAQEDITNRTRQQNPSFRVGDKVWLDLRNVKTMRRNKKLDLKHAKYTVTEVISSHNYRLDTPKGIHNVFHSQLLRPAASDPLPSQRTDDPQPPPHILGEDQHEEYEIEHIADERVVQRGRGYQKQYLVYWVDYQVPTWEPAAHFQDTEALDVYEASRGAAEEEKGGGNVRGQDPGT